MRSTSASACGPQLVAPLVSPVTADFELAKNTAAYEVGPCSDQTIGASSRFGWLNLVNLLIFLGCGHQAAHCRC